jgi:hypothetical protein
MEGTKNVLNYLILECLVVCQKKYVYINTSERGNIGRWRKVAIYDTGAGTMKFISL